MTTPDELERAVERLSDVEAVLRQGQGGIARDTDYAKRVSSDLRLILSERAELLATVERMRGQVFSVGDLLSYNMSGVLIRCTYRGDCEGWPLVSFDADGPDAVAIHVRPSKVKARAAFTTGEAKRARAAFTTGEEK